MQLELSKPGRYRAKKETGGEKEQKAAFIVIFSFLITLDIYNRSLELQLLQQRGRMYSIHTSQRLFSIHIPSSNPHKKKKEKTPINHPNPPS